MKKPIALLAVVSMLAQACSSPNDGGAPPDPVAPDIEEVAKLLKGPNPNFALAEIVAREIAQRSPEKQALIRAQAKVVISSAVEQLDYAQSLERSQFRNFFAGSPVALDPEYWSNSMAVQVTDMAKAGSFAERINVSVAGLVKNAAYERLMTAYKEEIKSGARAVARQVVEELEEKDPKAITEIDLARQLLPPERATAIQNILKHHDEILTRYNMTKDDQIRALFVGYVASEMAEVLKEHPTVKEILRLKSEADQAITKAKTVQALLTSIRDSHKEIGANLKEMKGAFKDVVAEFKDKLDKAEDKNNPASRKEARQYLIDMAKGEPRPATDGRRPPSAISGPQHVSPSMTRFMTSANKAAGSLDTILNSTETIAKTLGIGIDPGLKNVIETTRKISAGVKLANSVMTGFATGGPIGALAAFAGGSVAESIMGGGGDPNAAVMAELSAIKQDLAEIKQTQKQILDLQRETIKMIRDLAVMIDDYHREEMRELAAIKDELVTLEGMSTYLLNQKISSCNTILTFTASQDPKADPVVKMSLADIAFDRGTLNAKAGGLNGIRAAMSISDWTTCRSGFNEVFGNSSSSVEPLHGRYNVGRESDSGGRVEEKLLRPALDFFISQHVSPDYKRLALHLPVANIQTISLRKEAHVYSDKYDLEESEKLRADLNVLISTAAVEQWVTHLLPLYPYVSFGDDVGGILKDLPDGRGSVDAVHTATVGSRMWVASALERVQRAIAQQAILAGEPLLPRLHDKWIPIMTTKVDCATASVAVATDSYCFVWRNGILMSNLVNYRLHKYQGADAVAKYAASIGINGADHRANVAEALGVGVDRLAYDEQRHSWKLLAPVGSLNIPDVVLPKADLVTAGYLQYGEALPRLNRLAQRLAQELALVSPNTLSDQQARNLALVLLAQ